MEPSSSRSSPVASQGPTPSSGGVFAGGSSPGSIAWQQAASQESPVRQCSSPPSAGLLPILV